MQVQKRWVLWVSAVCCFCLVLVLFSPVAFAAEAGDAISFAEVYGLELADGESKRVSFKSSAVNSALSFDVSNDTTVENVVFKLNNLFFYYGLTVFYDSTSRQLFTNDSDGNTLSLEASVDGKVLTPKPSVSVPAVSSPTMTDTLSTISNVMTAVLGWVVAVSNAIVRNSILLLVVVIGFTGTGVALFRRMLRL